MRDTVAITVVLLVLLSLGGCSSEEDLEDRFYTCRDLIGEKESHDESLDCWTAYSRTLIENLLEQRRSTARILDYLGRYTKLLDYEELVDPPEIIGDFALMNVTKGRRHQTIVWEREEDGIWRIDVRELHGFWKPLNDALDPE